MSARLPVALVGFNSGGNPPLGLGYLKAYADADPELRRAVDIRILSYDYWAAPETAVIDLARLEPRVAGINVMHANLRKACRIASAIKTLLPNTLLLFGGVEAGPSAEHILNACPHVDLIVAGEGEQTFAEILKAVCAGARLPGIAGTVVREDGQPVRRPERPPLSLSRVPSPYLTGALEPEQFPAVHLETYRGCPYQCAYCYEGRGFATPRLFPEEQVLEELRWILGRKRRAVKFFDTTFNHYRERTLRILEFTAQYNRHGHRLGAEVRMESFDREMARAARSAACLDIETGLQSIRGDTLAQLGRTGSREAFERNLSEALQAGLRVIVHIMGGLPGDRLSDTLSAHDYVLRLGAEPCLFHTRVLPGTVLHERARSDGIQFLREPPFDVLRHATFTLADYQRYNRFGLARAVLGPYLQVVVRLAAAAGREPSALIEAAAEAFGQHAEWHALTARCQWWNAALDPAFLAAATACRERCRETIRQWLSGEMSGLQDRQRTALLALFEYVGALDRVKQAAPPPESPSWLWSATRLQLAGSAVRCKTPVDLRPILQQPSAGLDAAGGDELSLLIVRTADGTRTKVINPEMERLLQIFHEPICPRDAIRRYLPEDANGQHVAALMATVRTLASDGTLLPSPDPQEMAHGASLILRTLTVVDEPAVLRVYRENHRFFQTLAGIDEPSLEHIRGDVEDGPPGSELQKEFFGIVLRASGELIGVADVVCPFPGLGSGCFGLLLLSERHQSRGLGREAADLVERWAYHQRGVRRMTVGVELANQRACRFWRKQGYSPTGERFESTSLGRTNLAEVLLKRLEPAA